MNNLLEEIRKTDPDCIIVKKFDELLDEMKAKYHFNIETMKQEIKQLEQEVEQEKLKFGTDEYNQRILRILGNPSTH